MSTTPERRRTARALTSYRRAETQLEQARAELHAAIIAELGAGVRQAELVQVTGYTRESIRRIALGQQRHASSPAR